MVHDAVTLGGAYDGGGTSPSSSSTESRDLLQNDNKLAATAAA